MFGNGYTHLLEENESSVSADTPWTADFDDSTRTTLTDTSPDMRTSTDKSYLDSDNTGNDKISSSRQNIHQNNRSPTNNVKYTALRPTGVTELNVHDVEQDRMDHQPYDSYVRVALTSEKPKPLSKINVIICGLLLMCVVLVGFGLVYVFAILPAQTGKVVYPDGKTHTSDLMKLRRLGKDVVITECGLVRGTREGGAFAFRGIPYAVPPTGKNRWKPPKPLDYDSQTCWHGVLNATSFGSRCIQPKFDNPSEVEGSEDCLYLNVWTPSLNPDTLKPVMVWLHSGDFVYGSGDMPGMSPTTELAVATNSVYVSFNYRLGTLGFLALDQLRETARGPTGNYGFMDQQLVLQWVKKNIGHFGGDETKVSIFGHGSGATSVQALLLSPGSSGLFHRAWLTSPVAILNKTVDQACEDNKVFLTRTKCDTADCLRHLSAKEVSRASPWPLQAHWTLDQLFNIPHSSQLRNSLPIFDGHVVHRRSVKEGPEGPVVPVMLGATYFDLSSLATEQSVVNMTWDDYDDFVIHHVSNLGTEAAIQAKSLYSHQARVEYTSPAHFPPLPSMQFCRLIGDIKEVCPVKIVADDFAYLSSSSAPVYMYVAEIYPSHNMELSDGLQNTFVGWDMAAFFDGFQNLDFIVGQGEANFENVLRQEIMSFMKDGKPNALRWRTVNQSVGVIGRDVTVTPATADYFSKCDMWERFGFFRYTWNKSR